MRTTLTLDDIAALLSRVRMEQHLSLKETVNEALRSGLQQMMAPRPRPSYQTPSVDVGRCLLGSLDDISEVLAAAEGEELR